MKRNDLKDIKLIEIDELKKRVRKAKEEMEELVLDKNMRKQKDLKTVFKKRKDLAQMLTVLRQKEILKNLELTVESNKETEQKIEKGAK